MNKNLIKLLKMASIINKASDEELLDQLSEFDDAETLVELINQYEAKIAKLLRNQRRFFVDKVKSLIPVQKDEEDRPAIAHLLLSWFDEDDFEELFTDLTKEFLSLSVTDLAKRFTEAIDPDVVFNTFSTGTTDFIEDWAENLGKLMKLNTHEAVQEAINKGLELGESMDDIAARLEELPQFNRKRAEATAITEVLTACSAAQQESYRQSPSVVGKTWLHSGSKKNNPRAAHVALSGTTVGVEESFDVNGHLAMFPRDPKLPAKERVRCHCVLAPSVDKGIIGIDDDELEAIRAGVISEL